MTKVEIKGVKWKIRLFTPSSFIEKHSKGGEDYSDTCAVTLINEKEVHFRTDNIDIATIRHELFHCYFSSCMTESANLNSSQVEEISASIIGEYGEELVKHSKKIQTYLRKKAK